MTELGYRRYGPPPRGGGSGSPQPLVMGIAVLNDQATDPVGPPRCEVVAHWRAENR